MIELRGVETIGLPAGAPAERVRERWEEHAARKGWQVRRRKQGSGHGDEDTVHAYVSMSRWVADCPECNGGIACDPRLPDACCLDCGSVYAVTFPPADEVERARWALGVRPPAHRNWQPHRGETLTDLRADNLARGLRTPPQAIDGTVN